MATRLRALFFNAPGLINHVRFLEGTPEDKVAQLQGDLGMPPGIAASLVAFVSHPEVSHCVALPATMQLGASGPETCAQASSRATYSRRSLDCAGARLSTGTEPDGVPLQECCTSSWSVCAESNEVSLACPGYTAPATKSRAWARRQSAQSSFAASARACLEGMHRRAWCPTRKQKVHVLAANCSCSWLLMSWRPVQVPHASEYNTLDACIDRMGWREHPVANRLLELFCNVLGLKNYVLLLDGGTAAKVAKLRANLGLAPGFAASLVAFLCESGLLPA